MDRDSLLRHLETQIYDRRNKYLRALYAIEKENYDVYFNMFIEQELNVALAVYIKWRQGTRIHAFSLSRAITLWLHVT